MIDTNSQMLRWIMRFVIMLCTLLVANLVCSCFYITAGQVSGGKSDKWTQIAAIGQQGEGEKQIILTLGSWRKDDVEQVNYILQKFTEQHPHIVIKFDPTYPSDYNEVIETQLESGTAPDLFYLRSFAHSRRLFKDGYIAQLNDIEDIQNNFPEQMVQAWSTEDGRIYGVPLMAVSHAVYYNVDFFKKNNLKLPQTWENLLALAKNLKQQGVTPFANASGDAWTINGLVLQNVIPAIIGGVEGRLAYYNGERCFDDEAMVETFQAVKDISPYLPDNQRLLKYADSLQLFLQGKAPMWFGGSWDIPFFEEQGTDFTWNIFAIPPPEGKKHHVTFHPDAGIGLNQASPYMKESKLFLQWLTTGEFASLMIEQLPGFYPMHKQVTAIENRYAKAFLDLNAQYPTDIRFAWGAIRDGNPSAYQLSLQASSDVINGLITPAEAAGRLQDGLAQWYKPAQMCPKK